MKANLYTQNLIENAKRCSVSDVLCDREKRAERQKELLNNAVTLISFTLNIAGSIKKDVLFEKAFIRGIQLIQQKLSQNKIEIIHFEKLKQSAGYCAFFCLNENAEKIKGLMIELEEQSPFARLLDIDVIFKDGKIISRTQLGLSPRKCLLCQNEAKLCARSERHSKEELFLKTVELIFDELEAEFCDKIKNLAEKALVCELETTPKAGLVDKNNSGAHSDMNYSHFLKSIAAIKKYFGLICKKSIDCAHLPNNSILSHLRPIGIEAENAMLRATDGVNCHKGAIFSLGALCSAAGVLFGRDERVTQDSVTSLAKEICKEALCDFERLKEVKTHGEESFVKYKIGAARAEAAAGFPSVMLIGLPALKENLKNNMSLNDAGVWALVSLMSTVDDSCIIARSDLKTLGEVKTRAKELILQSVRSLQRVLELDSEFIQRNLSPGGCADLLAVTYFLYFLEN